MAKTPAEIMQELQKQGLAERPVDTTITPAGKKEEELPESPALDKTAEGPLSAWERNKKK